jgi:hypothetical protein
LEKVVWIASAEDVCEFRSGRDKALEEGEWRKREFPHWAESLLEQ